MLIKMVGAIGLLPVLGANIAESDAWRQIGEQILSADYIVGISPDNWDPDGALYGTRPSDPVSSDPNDDVDDDNNGAAGPYGYTWSGPVTLDDAEPAGETGLNNDPNRRALERERTQANGPVDFDQLAKLAVLTQDLDDPEVMGDAWS